MSSDDIVERLGRSDDFAVFTAGDGLPALRLMSETERRQEAADEIERLRAEHTFVERLVAGQLLSRMTELEADLAAERAEVERLMDGMEWAWSIIANGQYWDATDAVRHPEWEQAKLKWRDEHWHPALDRTKEARREQ